MTLKKNQVVIFVAIFLSKIMITWCNMLLMFELKSNIIKGLLKKYLRRPNFSDISLPDPLILRLFSFEVSVFSHGLICQILIFQWLCLWLKEFFNMFLHSWNLVTLERFSICHIYIVFYSMFTIWEVHESLVGGNSCCH